MPRPTLPQDQAKVVRVEVRMTHAQAEKLALLAGSERGGPDWLRTQIDKAKPPKKTSAPPLLPWVAP
jgi:hypothetical protein